MSEDEELRVTEEEDSFLTLEDDFAELLLDEDSSSQSSHTLEDESPEGRAAKSLSSSPQATNIAVQTKTPSQRERIFPP